MIPNIEVNPEQMICVLDLYITKLYSIRDFDRYRYRNLWCEMDNIYRQRMLDAIYGLESIKTHYEKYIRGDIVIDSVKVKSNCELVSYSLRNRLKSY